MSHHWLAWTWYLALVSLWSLEGVRGGDNDYNQLNRDGSYQFGYDTPDSYHYADANRNNVVRGEFGARNPGTGGIDTTLYTAGPRGFRPRGRNIHRKYDLGQAGPRPVGSPDDPYFDPLEDPSYSFGFRTRTYTRNESANRLGDVVGQYTYRDDVGESHHVEYVAGRDTGFHVKTPFPDSNPRAYGPLYFNGRGKPIPRGRTSIQRGLDGSYRFVSAGPDQRRTEISDSSGHVRGSYTYLDDKGVQHSVHYIAGPETGYRVLKNVKGPHLPTIFPFGRPGIVPPDFYDYFGKEGDVFDTAATGAIKPVGNNLGGGGGRPSKPDIPLLDNGIDVSKEDFDRFSGDLDRPGAGRPGAGRPGGGRPGGGRPGGGGYRPGGRPGFGGSTSTQKPFGGGTGDFSPTYGGTSSGNFDDDLFGESGEKPSGGNRGQDDGSYKPSGQDGGYKPGTGGGTGGGGGEEEEGEGEEGGTGEGSFSSSTTTTDRPSYGTRPTSGGVDGLFGGLPSGGRPSGPGGRPSGPGGRPTGPGGRPTGPGGRPTGPGGRPGTIGGLPSTGRPGGPSGGVAGRPTGGPGGGRPIPGGRPFPGGRPAPGGRPGFPSRPGGGIAGGGRPGGGLPGGGRPGGGRPGIGLGPNLGEDEEDYGESDQGIFGSESNNVRPSKPPIQIGISQEGGKPGGPGSCPRCNPTLVRNLGDTVFSVPPGASVRAHVQAIDLLPVVSQVPSPSDQFKADSEIKTEQLNAASSNNIVKMEKEDDKEDEKEDDFETTTELDAITNTTASTATNQTTTTSSTTTSKSA